MGGLKSSAGKAAAPAESGGGIKAGRAIRVLALGELTPATGRLQEHWHPA
jgi:hypothetical protein